MKSNKRSAINFIILSVVWHVASRHSTLPRTIYNVVGGFRQDITEMEGWYLSFDICNLYGFAKMMMLDDVIVITSARRANKGILSRL